MGPTNTNEKGRTIDAGTTAILECSRPSGGRRSFVRLIRTDGTQTEPLTIPRQRYDLNDNPVDLMAAMQSRINELEGSLQSIRVSLRDKLSMECKVKTARSGRGRFSQVAASMTDEEKQTRFKNDWRWLPTNRSQPKFCSSPKSARR